MLLGAKTGAIVLCIDSYNGGEASGRIYSPLQKEPEVFGNVMTLVKKLNAILDDGDYPQATVKCRGFGKKVTAPPNSRTDSKHYAMSEQEFISEIANKVMKGAQATYRLDILFRQNASWQGRLTWVEKEYQESFRSVLELMMLIDSSFANTGYASINAEEELRKTV